MRDFATWTLLVCGVVCAVLTAWGGSWYLTSLFALIAVLQIRDLVRHRKDRERVSISTTELPIVGSDRIKCVGQWSEVKALQERSNRGAQRMREAGERGRFRLWRRDSQAERRKV